jgi:hypothetical protein
MMDSTRMVEPTGRTARGEGSLGSSSFRSRSRSTTKSSLFSSAAATFGDSLAARSPAPAGAGGSEGMWTHALVAVATASVVATSHRRGGYGAAGLFLQAAGDAAGTRLGRPRFRGRNGLLCSWQSTRFVATTPSATASDDGLGSMGLNRARISLALTAMSARCTTAMGVGQWSANSIDRSLDWSATTDRSAALGA